MTPRLSLVIRSYNRLAVLAGLVESLLRQRHDSFEIVIVEQSTEEAPEARAKLAALAAQDPRVRILSHKPLGGARARNVGVAAARGAIVALLDDDDRPSDDDFLAQLESCFADPLCLGVTVRHRWGGEEKPHPLYGFIGGKRVMRFSPLLKLPLAWARHDQAVRPVDYVHGTGSAFRRELFERVGGWDEDTPIEDEASFAWRAKGKMRPGEYFAFDPRTSIRRDLDVGGGLGKRLLAPAGFFRKYMLFVHHILGRYQRGRVIALWPLYVAAGYYWTVVWLWEDSRKHRSFVARLGATLMLLITLPYHAGRMLAEPLGRDEGAKTPETLAALPR